MTSAWRLSGESDVAGRVEAYQTCELDPVRQAALWYLLGGLWLVLVPIYGVVSTLILYGLHGLGIIGDSAAAAVLAFGCAFAIVGAVDAFWRCCLVWSARSRFLREHQVSEDGESRTARFAQVNDATVVLQLAGGFLAALLLR